MVDILEDDDDHMILSHNRRDESVFDVFRVNVATGAETLIAENPGNIMSWGTDHEGKLRVAGTSDGVNTSLLYRATEADEFTPIVTTSFKEGVSPLFFTFDNKRLYVSSNRGRDKAAIFEFDPVTAKEGDAPRGAATRSTSTRSSTRASARCSPPRAGSRRSCSASSSMPRPKRCSATSRPSFPATR